MLYVPGCHKVGRCLRRIVKWTNSKQERKTHFLCVVTNILVPGPLYCIPCLFTKYYDYYFVSSSCPILHSYSAQFTQTAYLCEGRPLFRKRKFSFFFIPTLYVQPHASSFNEVKKKTWLAQVNLFFANRSV